MKIISKAMVIVTVICFTGISCIDEAVIDANAAKVAAAKKTLEIPAETDSDLDLPLVFDGVAISWASSNEDVISNTGIVTQPFFDTEVTLTATLTLGEAFDTKEFTVRVAAVSAEEIEAIIAAAKEALEIPAETDCDLVLPLVLDGVAISWASSDENVISNTGIVTQQPNDKEVTLTATLTLGSVSDTKEFTVRVVGYACWNGTFFETEAKLVEMIALNGMSSGKICRITIKRLDEGIVFNCTVYNGSFTSSIEDQFLNIKNASLHSGDEIYWFLWHSIPPVTHDFIEIVLTLEKNIIGYVLVGIDLRYPTFIYTIKSVLFPQVGGKYQNISEEYVKAEIEKNKEENSILNGSEAMVAAVKKELTIGGVVEGIAIGNNVILQSWINGVAISWVSSDEAVISSTGIVTRQLYDTEVTLTATLRRDNVDTKEFTVIVPALVEE